MTADYKSNTIVYMSRTVLQVPISAQLRKSAENEALRQGFSSLQDLTRLFLKKLADRAIRVTLEESIQLSERAIKRYEKIDEDIKRGKNVHSAKDVNDLMRQLHGNTLS